MAVLLDMVPWVEIPSLWESHPYCLIAVLIIFALAVIAYASGLVATWEDFGFLLLIPGAVVLSAIGISFYAVLLVITWSIAKLSRLFVAVASFALHPDFLWTYFCLFRPPRRGLKRHILEAEPGTQAGSLCATCKELIVNSPLLTGTSSLFARKTECHSHLTPNTLRESSKSCHLCSFLWQSSGWDFADTAERPDIEHSLSRPDEHTPLNPGLPVIVRRSQHPGTRSTLTVQLDRTAVPTSRPLVVRTGSNNHAIALSLPDPMQSNSLLNLAVAWIDTCIEKHPQCGKRQLPGSGGLVALLDDPYFAPSRLVRITKDDESPSHTIKLRLIETADLSEPVSLLYAALSHRWGRWNPDFKMLTADTLAQFKDNVPFGPLPRNFQHAIAIAVGIGIEYLWIDCLCIIQHSKEDWLREAAAMGRVYAKAVCTISATAADGPEGGCFTLRDPFLGDLVLHPGTQSSPVIESPYTGRANISNLLRQRVELAPISSRGWTFQERVLSKRVLHFASGLLLFECDTCLATELVHHRPGVLHGDLAQDAAGGLGEEDLDFVQRHTRGLLSALDRAVAALVPILLLKDDDSSKKRIDNPFAMPKFIDIRRAFQTLSSRRLDHQLEEHERIEFHLLWMQIVRQYSRRELTVKTDRLMAVIGVARHVQEAARIRFAGGLWANTISLDLLWSSQRPLRSRSRVGSDEDLPTWSWVSAHGPINTVAAMHLRDRTCLRFAVLVDNDEWMVQTIYRHDGMVHNAALVHHKAYLWPFHQPEGLPGANPIRRSSRWESDIEFVPDVELLEGEEEQLHLLPIVMIDRPVGGDLDVNWWSRCCEMHGIVVRPVEYGAHQDAYERVGYFVSGNSNLTKYLRPSDTDPVGREYRASLEIAQHNWEFARRIDRPLVTRTRLCLV